MTFLRSRGGFIGAAMLLALVLTACTGGPTEPSWGDISVLDNNLILAFSGTILQLNPDDGTPINLYDTEGNVRTDPETNAPRRWEISLGATMRFYHAPLVVSEETLLVASYDRKLFQIERDAARIENTVGVDLPGHVVADVLQANGLLYVPLSEKDLLALNEDDFSQRWRFTTTRGVWAAPLLLNGVLYLTSMDHFIYAIDAESGEEIWRVDTGGAIPSAPLLYNNSLYVGTFGREIVQVSLNGRIIARYSTADWVWGTPVIANNILYTGDLVGNVYALELTNAGFTELWRHQVTTRAIRPTPVVYEDRLIVASRDNFVYWLNRNTGDTIVRQDVRGEVMAEMLLLEPAEGLNITQPMLFVNTMARENLLFAFPADGNGEALWKYPR